MKETRRLFKNLNKQACKIGLQTSKEVCIKVKYSNILSHYRSVCLYLHVYGSIYLLPMDKYVCTVQPIVGGCLYIILACGP